MAKKKSKRKKTKLTAQQKLDVAYRDYAISLCDVADKSKELVESAVHSPSSTHYNPKTYALVKRTSLNALKREVRKSTDKCDEFQIANLAVDLQKEKQ